MKIDLYDIDTPLNLNERYLHGMLIRQNILIEQMSSLLEAYAKVHNLHAESNKSTVDVKEPEHVEEVVVASEAPVRPTRKRK